MLLGNVMFSGETITLSCVTHRSNNERKQSSLITVRRERGRERKHTGIYLGTVPKRIFAGKMRVRHHILYTYNERGSWPSCLVCLSSLANEPLCQRTGLLPAWAVLMLGERGWGGDGTLKVRACLPSSGHFFLPWNETFAERTRR